MNSLILNSNLRKATLSDLTEISNLISLCFDTEIENYFINNLKYFIKNNYSYVYIIEDTIVGFVNIDSLRKLSLFDFCVEDLDIYENLKPVLGFKFSNFYEICNLCVHPSYRGLDIGYKLVYNVLKEFPEYDFIVIGMNQTKIGKWLAEKIFVRLNFYKLIEKDNFWYNHSLKYKYNCNLCLKEPGDNNCCRCSGSIWLL